MFKVGDKVVCIDAEDTFLTKGSEYTILDIDGDIFSVKSDHGHIIGYRHTRFGLESLADKINRLSIELQETKEKFEEERVLLDSLLSGDKFTFDFVTIYTKLYDANEELEYTDIPAISDNDVFCIFKSYDKVWKV